jgi:hypothetical protein
MIILDGNTQTFQAVLGGAVSTDQPEFQVSYGKLNANDLNSYLTNQGELNDTTDVTLVAGVASRQIGIKSISVFNRDSAQVVVTFKKDISATDRSVYRVTLEANESVHYESGSGWYVVTSTGEVKGSAAVIPTHTGDVTGDTALTIDPTAISGKSLETAVSGDMVLFWDTTDSLLKRANIDDFGGGGGGGTAWEQVTSADTIAAGEGFAVKNTGADFDITIEATIAANDEYIIHNSSESTGAVDVEPNTGHTIKGKLGDVVGGTDTLVLAPGETVQLVAVSSSVLEIV